MQFRAIDWGFESCSLVLKLPPESLSQVPFAGSTMNSSLVLGPDVNYVSIFRMDRSTSSVPFDTKTLTYATKPKVEERLATVKVDYEMEWHWQFGCPRDSVHAFEFRATNDFVKVEWWQNKESNNAGM